MLRQAAAVVATLGYVGSALGQMTLVTDDRYNEYFIEITNINGFTSDASERDDASFGSPFASSVGDTLFFSGSNGNADADQDSSITTEVILADLGCSSFADALFFESVYAVGYSQVDVVFSVAAPSPYEFEVTSWSQVSGGQAAAWLEWADGSGAIEVMSGVGSGTGVLAPGEYHLYIGVLSEVFTTDFPPDSESAGVVATFTVTPPGCVSEADVTTTGAAEGEPGFGVPDGEITGADIQFFVNAWFAGCP